MDPKLEVSHIREFYNGKSVFITGGTGFMGKVLIEKLLRSCDDINTIYLLMRTKSNTTTDHRKEELLKSQAFEKLKEEKPNFEDKIKVIHGDLNKPIFDISTNDLNILIENVSVIFFLAATVRFDQGLSCMMEDNVLSLESLIQLCHKLPKLQSVIFTSTAYCNCTQSVIEEKVYPSMVSPDFAIQAVKNKEEDVLEALTRELLKKHPNTYSFSKSIAENYLQITKGDIPLAIVRPSIVTGSLEEPHPGWIDSFYGPSGLVIGNMTGILRTQILYEEKVFDIIPVDISINMIIAIAWYTASVSDRRMLVYNCTSGQDNPITWGELHRNFQPLIPEYPLKTLYRYPQLTVTRSHVSNRMNMIVDHYIPALLLDILCILIGKKPRMIKLYQQVNKGQKYLEFYSTQQWKIISKNKHLFLERMSKLDKEMFNCDIKSVNWKSYMTSYIIGLRKFLMKDPLSTIPKAKRNLRRLLWINRAIKACLYAGVAGVISAWVYVQ